MELNLSTCNDDICLLLKSVEEIENDEEDEEKRAVSK